MDQALLPKIKAIGHWRVKFTPLVNYERRLLLGECKAIVEESVVSIRGWDFPHVSRRNDETGGYDLDSDFVQNWTDWHGFYEFWRMYQSAQFLSYIALREDTMPHEHGSPQVPVLHVTPTIYSIVEFVEFARRIVNRGLYDTGVNVTISLIGSQGRTLMAGRNRMPFFPPQITNAPTIVFEKSFQKTVLLENSRDIAVDACIHLFDKFGWNPARSQISIEVERFYAKDFR